MSLGRGPRLGIDPGGVRVGLAASDPEGLIATPVDTLARDLTEGAPSPADMGRIAAEVDERSAAVVYVGLPRSLNGSEGKAGQEARAYAEALARLVDPVPVRLVDERMTTVTAHRSLHAAGRAGRKHRAVVDQAAAAIILQTALDIERGTGARAGEAVEVY